MMRQQFAIDQLAWIAQSSDDPDTQTACILELPDGYTITSANRVPYGVEAAPYRLKRPQKYAYIMHAEQRAIAHAARDGVSLSGATMYLNWFPCAECARLIIQAGITTLVADREKYEARKDDPIYGFAAAIEMLTEAEVTISWLGEGGSA